MKCFRLTMLEMLSQCSTLLRMTIAVNPANAGTRTTVVVLMAGIGGTTRMAGTSVTKSAVVKMPSWHRSFLPSWQLAQLPVVLMHSQALPVALLLSAPLRILPRTSEATAMPKAKAKAKAVAAATSGHNTAEEAGMEESDNSLSLHPMHMKIGMRYQKSSKNLDMMLNSTSTSSAILALITSTSNREHA
jgi:hypothetical protein